MLSLQEERESSKSLQACLGTILENRFLIKKVHFVNFLLKIVF